MDSEGFNSIRASQVALAKHHRAAARLFSLIMQVQAIVTVGLYFN